MKKLLFLLLLLPVMCNAQLSVHIADSPLKGNVGLEYRYHSFALSTGYRPAVVFNLDLFHSFSAALTYFHRIDPATVYISVGRASKLVYRDKVDYLYKTAPHTVVTIGTRFRPYDYCYLITPRLSFDFGAGLMCSKYDHDLTMEVAMNFNLTKR